MGHICTKYRVGRKKKRCAALGASQSFNGLPAFAALQLKQNQQQLLCHSILENKDSSLRSLISNPVVCWKQLTSVYCLILYSFGVLRHTHILHTEKQVVLKLSFPFCCFCSLYSLLVVGHTPFHCVIMLWGTFIKPAFVAQGILLISEGVARKRQGKFFVMKEFRNIFRSSENPKNNKPSKV